MTINKNLINYMFKAKFILFLIILFSYPLQAMFSIESWKLNLNIILMFTDFLSITNRDGNINFFFLLAGLQEHPCFVNKKKKLITMCFTEEA